MRSGPSKDKTSTVKEELWDRIMLTHHKGPLETGTQEGNHPEEDHLKEHQKEDHQEEDHPEKVHQEEDC